jgi:hypothetical protein
MSEPSVHIDSLRLTMSGLDETAATEFARMVARNLVPGLTAAAAEGGPLPGRVETAKVSVPGPSGGGGSSPDLARTVADEVLLVLLAGTTAPPGGALS